jgi:uncharacterized protein (DUF1800 family)
MCPVNFRAKTARALSCAALGALLLPITLCAIIDRDGNQLSDIWQLHYGTGNVSGSADADRDGVTNLEESAAGTNPLDPASRPVMAMQATAGQVQIRWTNPGDKRYEVFASPTLGPGAVWTSAGVFTGNPGQMAAAFSSNSGSARFYRVQIDDLDTDNDGLADWEERRLGWDMRRANTEGAGTTDLTRLNTALGLITDANATNDNTVTIAALDPDMVENWPEPAVAVLRRTGSVNAITVNYVVGGTATAGADYQGPASGSVSFGLGVTEVLLNFTPVNDGASEADETITVTLQSGTGYIIGTTQAGAQPANVATITLINADAGYISEAEAVRFLAQATFGATTAEIARVQQLGFEGWIDDQFTRAALYHLPLVQTWHDEFQALPTPASAGSTERTEVWWRRALATDASSDPLRQRIAHAFSQICVISDRVETLDGNPRGMAAYHDRLLENAFGNYRDLLKAVTLHPTMGIYLSHLRNQKANPSRNIYPDENYAREIMQLFSIGLWELNADGTRKVDGDGQFIPTYDNNDISNFARVFTGLSYGKKYTSSTNFTVIDTTGFFDGNAVMWEQMRGFDAYHDLASKTLLNGEVLPARTASAGGTGTATMADVDAAMTNLTNHSNTGPFIARLLIQRLVTSNPSPAYIGRVSAAFANNGAGVRGDLKAVVKAILLDTEARNSALIAEPDQGLQREPYLRYVAYVRALATLNSVDGRTRGFRNLDSEFLQRPYSSGSVFNFYSPDYQPLGVLKNAGLVGPEFQITNGVTGMTSPNRFQSSANSTSATALTLGYVSIILNRDGQSDSTLNTAFDTAPWINDARYNPEAMISRLNRLLAADQLSPDSLRYIARAVRRLADPLDPSGSVTEATRITRATDRLRVALHLVAISPECSVLK